MWNKIVFGALWLVFVSYAFLLAPPDRPDTLQLIIDLSTGKWAGINPLIIALFNLMGILPMVYACLILIDGKIQQLPAGLFSAISFGVGAFAILLYLAIRHSLSGAQVERVRSNGIDRGGIIKLVDSRWVGVVLTIGASILLVYGITQGDWPDFVSQWQTSRFIHVMSLDFCLLTLVLPVAIADDINLRHFTNPQTIKLLSWLPLFGALIYLCIRPNLIDATNTTTQEVV